MAFCLTLLQPICSQKPKRINVGYINIFIRNSVWWSHVKLGPPDIILGITEAFKRDTDPKKVNLGVGAYKDDEGKPYVLPSVRKAEEYLYNKCLNHEYIPIGGDEEFCLTSAKLAFGEDSRIFTDKSYCTVQSLSGSGALRIGLETLKKYVLKKNAVWLSAPTWGNHHQICNSLNIPHHNYRYFDPKTKGFDMQGCTEDFCKMPEGSVIILHECAHNPTGVDPRKEQWEEISKIIKEKKLVPFFDMAYQGFATGDIINDAYALRLFVKDGHELLVAQSYAKNLGLYGERIGALTVVCGDEDAAKKLLSQIKIIIRTLYSSPPVYGSRIVKQVLNNQELKSMWLQDLKVMADRIITMRQKLRSGIEGAGNKGNWQHITEQIGMFCYTGLNPDQVARLTKEFHIYLTKDGRISVAGVSSKNVDYVAKAIHTVTS